MIAITCRKCGSADIRNNGKDKYGRQKYYCKSCKFYGSLFTKDAERAERAAMVLKLHAENVSQRAIARITGISRSTVIQIIRNSQAQDANGKPETQDANEKTQAQ